MVPIRKPGKNPNESSSYRPISLLSTLSKLAERVILKRMNHFEQKEKMIVDHQFGFREKHNTVQQVVRIVNDTSIKITSL